MHWKSKTIVTALLSLCMLGLAGMAPAAFAKTKTIKVAFIDPLSGSFAPVGVQGAQALQFMFHRINESGQLDGYKIKLVPFDDKLDPKTALVEAQKAADQGIHFIFQGDGANVSFALADWVRKHNRDHPDNKLLYFNYAATDPGLSNKDCGFYSFNLDTNTNMRVSGLVDYLKPMKDVHKVLLIDQDYSFGHAFSNAAQEMIHAARPDIEIVGDVFVPIGKTKDFTPYISQIKQSGAQVVFTGNWGPDLALLVKAADQTGLTGVKFFTFFAGLGNAAHAIGDAGAGRVVEITPWVAGVDNAQMAKLAKAFREKYDNDLYFGSALYMTKMLTKAIKMAGGADDATQVALALEGMHFSGPLGDAYIRADNHSILLPLYVSTLSKGVEPSLKGTNVNFKVNKRIEAVSTLFPTSCTMEDRPEGAVSMNVHYHNSGK